MAAHRYWRLYITAPGTWNSIGELELRDSIGGPDRTGSGTATASHYYDASYLPSNACDNNAATAWANSGGAPPEWWKYDFGVGNAYDIVEISLKTRAGKPLECPRAFQIQYSDNDSDWTTAWSYPLVDEWKDGQTRVFTNPAAVTPTTVNDPKTDISGCIRCCLAEDIAAANNDPLAQWSDTSGSANHLTQGTEANKPLYLASGDNSWPAVVFDGDSFFNFSGPSLSAGSVFAVLKSDADPAANINYSCPWHFGTALSGNASHHPYTDGVLYESAGTSGRKYAGDPADSLAALHTYLVRSAADDFTIDLNGARIYASGTNTVEFATSGGRVGHSSIAMAYYYAGRFYAVIEYDHALSLADALGLQAWAQKYFSAKPSDPPDTPTGLTATAVAYDQIDVSWDAMPRATSYTLQRAPDVGGSPGSWSTIYTGADTSFPDTGRAELTKYWYKVKASNTGGDSAYCSAASATTPTSNTAPGAPTITSPTNGSTVGASFTLAVTPGSDPDSGQILTTYYRTTLNGGTPSGWTSIDGTATVTSAAGSLLIEAKTNDGIVDGPTSSVTVTVATTPPNKPSVTGVTVHYSFATIAGSAYASSIGKVQQGARFRVYELDGVTVAWDSGWVGAWTTYTDAPLSPLTPYGGATVQYRDELGNVSLESDLSAPFITGDTPADEVTFAGLALKVADATPEARATQVVVEPATRKPGYAEGRATQVVVELAIPSKYATGARIVRKVVGRILVTNAHGVWVDLCELDGKNFVEAADWEFSIDTPVGQATVIAFREVSSTQSLAPTMERSLYNREDFEGDSEVTLGAFAPLVMPGRGLRIQFAIVDADVTATEGDFQTWFDGYVDLVDWAPGETCTGGKRVHLEGRDKGCELLDHFIEQALTYELSGGYPLEQLMQQILDDNAEYYSVTVDPGSDRFTGAYHPALENGDRLFFAASTLPGGLAADTQYFVVDALAPTFKVAATRGGSAIDITSAGSADLRAAHRVMLYSEHGTDATPFNPSDSPGWAISPSYKQEQESLLEALRTLALQIGYDVRYVRQPGTAPWRLTLINPDRGQTTPDYSLTAAQYIRVGKLAISRADVRNVVRVIYNVDDSTDPPTGDTVQVEETASQAKYRRRFCSIGEPSTSAIDTKDEATAMANAALLDLQEPLADTEVEMHFRPATELRDLIRFLPNGVHFDTAQQLAVVSHRHQVARSEDGTALRTTVQARGTPVGAYRDWLKRDTRTITGRQGPAVGETFVAVNVWFSLDGSNNYSMNVAFALSGQMPAAAVWLVVEQYTDLGGTTVLVNEASTASSGSWVFGTGAYYGSEPMTIAYRVKLLDGEGGNVVLEGWMPVTLYVATPF